MYDMRIVAPTVCKLLDIRTPSASELSPLSEVADKIGKTNKLAVIVIDAFGISTWKKTEKKTPTLNQLKINYLVIHSVMKSITPVNFATMLTGASPIVHGITDREMPLMNETIFDVMREGDMISATAARALSSLGILISPHADFPGIAESNLDSEVIKIAITKLIEGVNLLWVQLLDIDDASHTYGPYSKESIEATTRVDENLSTILKTASKQGYSVIILADHGQHPVKEGSYKGTHGTEIREDIEVPLLWANNSELKEMLRIIEN
jgi:predicted AlkP superfamily pyrophosphatase or phosphodiesterase